MYIYVSMFILYRFFVIKIKTAGRKKQQPAEACWFFPLLLLGAGTETGSSQVFIPLAWRVHSTGGTWGHTSYVFWLGVYFKPAITCWGGKNQQKTERKLTSRIQLPFRIPCWREAPGKSWDTCVRKSESQDGTDCDQRLVNGSSVFPAILPPALLLGWEFLRNVTIIITSFHP